MNGMRIAAIAWPVACAAALAFGAGSARAQAWPSKPIRLIVPYPAAGPVDDVARLIALRLGDAWGQTVVIDNRSGASGNIAVELTARAAPDGHTLLIANTGPITINPSFYRKLPVDPLRDLVPVVQAVTGSMVLVVNLALPVKSIRDLVEAARAKPGQLSYASAGIGNLQHIAMERFKIVAGGIDMVHVPYKGAAASFLDLIAGQVHLQFANIAGAVPQIRAGKMRVIGVSSAKRAAALPDVPAVAEVYPGFDFSTWMGFFVPAATPKAIVAKLNAEIGAIVRRDESRQRLAVQGTEPAAGSPAEFLAFLRRESATYAEVIRVANIRAD